MSSAGPHLVFFYYLVVVVLFVITVGKLMIYLSTSGTEEFEGKAALTVRSQKQRIQRPPSDRRRVFKFSAI
jgi:hypothetical protein